MITLTAIAYVDGLRVARALHAGIARVLADTEHLNRINVYPVADSDTGTNIASTLISVRERLAGSQERNAGVVLGEVADAALDGSRGNSGAILTQFLQGMADHADGRRRLNVEQLVAALSAGANQARDALSEPREGTILTVISDYASAVRQSVAEASGQDIVPHLTQGLLRARESLARTPELLDVLRKAGVVDAGGQAFVYLLEGISDYIAGGDVGNLPEISLPQAAATDQAAGQEMSLRYRYCTECMLSGENIQRRRLRERLADFGDSVVVAGTRNKLRLHLHTDDPEAVFRAAAELGTVSAQKADDMRSQQHTSHLAGRKTVIVSDTAADIPEERLEQLDIHVVPLRVQFGEKGYLDRITLTPTEFYAELRRNPVHPTTSQPTPGDLRRHYEFLASHHESVVSLHVSSQVSGTFQAAQTAAARTRARGTVIPVDTGTASLGQAWLAIRAAECAAAGLDGATVAADVERMRGHTRTFAVMRDMSFAVRGGRLPGWVRTVGDFLRLTPVITSFPDGRIGPCGALFGRKRYVQQFARYVLKTLEPTKQYRVAVGHGDAPEDAEALYRLLSDGVPELADSFVTELGTAFGAHGGPGVLAVSWQQILPLPDAGLVNNED